ncbi:ATP-dependent DNA helicase [Marichromatium gracile]|uniref:DNA 5'-3' helicase n=1 Tax=Marichromatium gracile TaxID=1048 RepID=A0ABR5VM01_MARGR|nr:ATP-dependent DNA helicase [Marichromatium gracile]KXX66162.1 helicase [Marichromatium gracile]
MELARVFGDDGPLSARVPGFRPRPPQREMAERVGAVIDGGGVLVCEAGTGTGKTFAYLVPAILSGRKVLISTGTRNLQDQLFHRDLPLIRDALGLPLRAALLKGRANYLCVHRLGLALDEPGRHDRVLRAHLEQVRDWSANTRSGDIAELPLPDESPVWPLVTSTTDNCLGQECPQWQSCHLLAARREAQAADLVVVNHHLFCADLALKDEGFGDILPGADCFILDEAHQLPDTASTFFGIALSSRQLHDLLRDTELEYQREAGDVPELLEHCARVHRVLQDLRLALGSGERRGPWEALKEEPAVMRALDALARRLTALGEGLGALGGRGKGLDACAERATELLARLQTLLGEPDERVVRWFETQGRGFRLHQTPLEVSGVFRAQMARPGSAWVLTSATLAVGDDFGHFVRRLGLDEAETARWESPFDYSSQALWFVPRGLSKPSEPDYNQQVLALAREVIGYSRGRAFLLFTSHRALREVAAGLVGQIDYPLLVQGQAPRGELLERFRALGNAVLLGTSSFWEGVDVRGEALSCVLIDRLPFASPGDPVLAARIEALRQRGGNPFRDYQLPQAVIALKQGAGRLIRGSEDRGVLVVCDPRLLSRSYGYAFLDSLPRTARTRDIADVRDFFATAD